MTITLTREEAQQILDVLWNAFDLQQEEINQHIIKYGEFYRPQRVEFMKKELGSIEQMKETINNKIAQPEKTDMQIGLTYEEANPPEPTGSFSSWENTMCNVLGTMRTQTQNAWHDGYASAKAEREWVGLTDEEVQEIVLDFLCDPGQEHIHAIEAKLKEKNCG
jgi:hypothetical protein